VAANNKNKKPTSDEPVLYKRERNKINSLARALQLDYSLYDRTTAMRFAAISDEITDTKKSIESLKMDMAEILHQEFIYLFGKLTPLLHNNKQRAENMAEIDYGGRS
jgi:hypothetical protein